jgi:hypothetical protein
MAYHMSSGPASSGSMSVLYLQFHNQANQIVAEAQKDPEKALRAASLVQDAPYPWGSLKADLLLQIADLAGKEHADLAAAALQEGLKSLEHHSVLIRCKYFVLVADEYLRIGETDKAVRVLTELVKAIRELYAPDVNSDDPNRASKSAWPSTVVARACVALAGRVSTKLAQEMISELPDVDLRVFARIELANMLLRLPSYPALIHERHKQDRVNRVSVFPIPSS